MKTRQRKGRARQRGAALMVSLMFLLVMTMLGLAAIRATTQQTRMAAGMQFQTSAFQAAEAAIRTIHRAIFNAPPGTYAAILIRAGQGVPQNAAPAIEATGVVTSAATLTALDSCVGVVAENTSLVGVDDCCFDIEGAAQYGGSSASSVQAQRISLLCPE